jgi:hypothetical protein
MCPIPNGFRDRVISPYSSKIVDKQEILHTVSNTGIYCSSDEVGRVYLLSYLWLHSPLDIHRFFSFLIYTQSVWLLGRRSTRRKAATYTQNNTNEELTHTDIDASSGIRTHDPSVRAGEDG